MLHSFKFSPGAPHIVHAFSSHQMPNNVKLDSMLIEILKIEID